MHQMVNGRIERGGSRGAGAHIVAGGLRDYPRSGFWFIAHVEVAATALEAGV